MEEAPCVDLRPNPFLSVVFDFLAMSIDIKCNSCSAKYSVSDRLAGGSVKCSKCQAPIHVPIVPRQPPRAPATTAAEAAADAADLAFDYTPNLTAPAGVQTIAAPTAREIAPQQDADDEPVPEQAPGATAERPKGFRFAWPRFPFRRSGGSLSVAAPSARTPSADYRIRNYWTARLAPSLWVLSLVAGLSLAYLAVRQLLALGGLPAELQPTVLWGGVARIAGVVVGLIVVRISLETVSLLFEIAKTLREVRDELRKGV